MKPHKQQAQQATTTDVTSEGRDANVVHEPLVSDTSLDSPNSFEAETVLGEEGARGLLKRTPVSYMLNQVYGLWFLISWFLLITLITRSVSTEQYGIFAVSLTAYNTILYLVALGLEDALTVYVPRVFSEHGAASAGSLIRRLLLIRMIILATCTIILTLALPSLASLIALLPIPGVQGVANGLRDPQLSRHIIPIALYILGTGATNLLSSVCSALMRMRAVLVLSGLTQLGLLVVGFVLLRLGFGINGMLWMLAISSLLTTVAFALWLAPVIFARGNGYKQPLRPVIRLGLSAWLTNLVNGALLKQVSVLLLAYFAVSLTLQGFFNLSFQLADSANLLLVAGFQGVGGSALAAAAVSKNYDRLARSWETLIKVETLLAGPVLVFSLFNAQNIVDVLYTRAYSPVGPLLAIFLFFNLLVRVLGTTIHQSTLYVIHKARLVVLAQWIGLGVVIAGGVFLIPRYGPAGALIADGIARLFTGLLLLAFLWRDLPRHYPVGYTARFLLALTLAALPGIWLHPTNRILLGLYGCVFLVLCAGLLYLIKPLTQDDLDMIQTMNPTVAKYVRGFARKHT
jgi:O-antigen/teichoic acid export membrane protein